MATIVYYAHKVVLYVGDFTLVEGVKFLQKSFSSSQLKTRNPQCNTRKVHTGSISRLAHLCWTGLMENFLLHVQNEVVVP